MSADREIYSPENPPPLRRDGESVEDYRARCGWDRATDDRFYGALAAARLSLEVCNVRDGVIHFAIRSARNEWTRARTPEAQAERAGHSEREEWKRAIDWLRNNYQDHQTIGDLCDAMLAASAAAAEPREAQEVDGATKLLRAALAVRQL